MTADILSGVRVLALVPRLWPTVGTGNQRTTAMVTGFARAGARVTAYVPEPPYARGPYPPELHGVEVKVRRDPLAHLGDRIVYGATVLGFEDRYIPFSRAVLAENRWAPPPDAIFVSAAPFSAFVAAAALAAELDVPLIGDLRDAWSRHPLNKILGPWHQRLEERREARAVAGATALSAPIQEIFDSLVQPFDGPTRVIEHGCDVDAIRAGVGPPLPLGPGEPLVLVYAGMRYGPLTEEGFVRTFAQLEAPEPVTLRLIGCPRPAVATPPGLTIEVVEQVPHHQLIRHYAQAHALLNFISPQGLQPVVRSKFEEYKATGRPVLAVAPTESRLHAMTAGHAGGQSVAEGDARGLASALAGIRASAEGRIDYRHQRTSRSYAEVGREASQLLAEVLTGSHEVSVR